MLPAFKWLATVLGIVCVTMTGFIIYLWPRKKVSTKIHKNPQIRTAIHEGNLASESGSIKMQLSKSDTAMMPSTKHAENQKLCNGGFRTTAHQDQSERIDAPSSEFNDEVKESNMEATFETKFIRQNATNNSPIAEVTVSAKKEADEGQKSFRKLEMAVADVRTRLDEYQKLLTSKLGCIEEKISRPESLGKLQLTVNEATTKILDFVYSSVTKATSGSLGHIQDAIKKQMKEELDRQFQQLKSLVTSFAQVKEPEYNNGAGGVQPPSILERYVSEHSSSAEVERAMRQMLASPAPSNNALALKSLANDMRELSLTVEEVEKIFRKSNIDIPLASEIRLRLLRMEWLARKYNEFRNSNSLPTSIELSTAKDGLKELSSNLAKAIENSLQYWHAPQDYLQAVLDQIVSRDLPELIKICDSTGRSRLFDDSVRKLLDLAHLEDISPQYGDQFDSTRHAVLDFEKSGVRDTIVRVITRGFRYKNRVLNKPMVIVGS